jgi:hypothetical protein
LGAFIIYKIIKAQGITVVIQAKENVFFGMDTWAVYFCRDDADKQAYKT